MGNLLSLGRCINHELLHIDTMTKSEHSKLIPDFYGALHENTCINLAKLTISTCINLENSRLIQLQSGVLFIGHRINKEQLIIDTSTNREEKRKWMPPEGKVAATFNSGGSSVPHYLAIRGQLSDSKL